MIISPQNEHIKNLSRLRNKQAREKSGTILLDGKKIIQIAIESGIEIKSVYYSCPDNEMDFLKFLNKKQTPVFEVSKGVFSKISYGDIDTGFVAEAFVKEKSLESFPKYSNPLYIILENLEKPGNIGAILRTADAIGVSGLIVCDPKTDLYNPNIIRASIGTCFTVPYVSAKLAELKKFIKDRHLTCFALTPRGEKKYLDCNFKRPSAIIAGNEHDGLSDGWLNDGTETVFIPMQGTADSLNVSVAVTVVVYEAFRQNFLL
jgi:RNA methyltransferase, TrmH family